VEVDADANAVWGGGVGGAWRNGTGSKVAVERLSGMTTDRPVNRGNGIVVVWHQEKRGFDAA